MASAFALGALSPQERDAYRGHLATCRLCRELVGEFQTVADLLPETIEEEPASPEFKDRILAQARRELEGRPGEAPARALEGRPARVGWRWPGWMTPVPLGVTVVLVLVIAGLIAWNVNLQVGGGEELRREQLDLIEAIAAGAPVTRLSGTETAPGASGTLVQAPEEGKAFLLVRNMPTLGPNEEFHVWRIVEGVPSDVASFVLPDDTEQLVTLPVDFAGADTFGLSIEEVGSRPATPNAEGIVFLSPL